MDPAIGKRLIKLEEFLNIWTGTIVEFYPSREIVFFTKNITLLSLCLNYIKKEKQIFKKSIIISIFLIILTIFSSYYFKIVLDNITSGQKFLNQIFIIFFAITLFKIFFYKLKLYYESHLNKNIDIYLLRDFINHVLNLPSKVIQSKTTGEIVSRINDLNNFKNLFSEMFISLFTDSLLIISLIPILIIINKTLFLVLVITLIVYLLLGLLFKNLIYKNIFKNITLENKFISTFIESITMINSIKNLSGINDAIKYIEIHAANYIEKSFNLINLNNIQLTLKNIINELGYYTIYTISFILYIKQKLNIADLITFQTLMIYFLQPVKNLIDNIPKYNFIKVSIEKVSEFMNIEKEQRGDLVDINNFDINIEDISFSYNKISEVLSNFNLNIREGEHVLIKGKSGSGKSTICKLLTKKEDNYKGVIKLGDNNIKDLSINTINKNIMYISQKEYLYSDTLKANIKYHKRVSPDEFKNACDISELNEIVKTKPARYETYINVDSNNFSGGEKQRIILARAIINKFKILIIDEALSEVDMETEKNIINNLRNQFKDKTIIYISHKNLEKEFNKVIYV